MKMIQRKKSLLFKNVFMNLIIVIISIISIVTILYLLSAEAITKEIEQQIYLKLVAAKDSIEETRKTQEMQLEILSKSSEAYAVLNGQDRDQFELQAEGLTQNYSDYLEEVLLINNSGKVVYDSLNNEMNSLNLSERAYFQESMKGNIAHSDIIESKNTGSKIEVVSVPVVRDDKVIGVLATTMNIDYIKDLLKEIKIGESGYAILLDEKGNFIYHPNAELIGTSLADIGVAKLAEILPDMLAGKEGIADYTYEGVKKMNMYLPLSNWSLSINAVKSEYLVKVNEMLQSASIIGFVMLVIASAASFVNSYFMIKRVKKVQKSMNEATNGDMTIEVEEINLKKCWEIKKCNKTECPAYKNNNLKCWEISKTLCNDEIQSDAITKLETCKNCMVYTVSEGDELGQMTRSLSIMINTIRNLIYNIAQIAEQLSSSSQELSSASEETSSSAEGISQRMEEMSSSSQDETQHVESINMMTHEMNTQLSDSVMKINNMSEEAGIVNNKAEIGKEKIGSAINGMEQINSQTEKIGAVMNELIRQSAEIGEINGMITAIAEETNLLSLNASIEAARAGENGRGFGVVADEIGKLALQSQESAKGISVLIDRITESIQSANQLMNTETEFVQNGIQSVQESKNAFEEIAQTVYQLLIDMKEVVSFVESVKGASGSVTQAVEKMTSIIEESGASMEEITATTEEQTSVSEEISKSATELASMASELMEAVSAFKV